MTRNNLNLRHFLIGRHPRRTLIRSVLLGVLTFMVFGFLARPARIEGISMAPTLANGSLHLVNLFIYRFREPQRGDIAAIALPGGRSFYMKRILGLPGEQVAFERGYLLINGEPWPEPYLSSPGTWQMAPVSLPDHHYFVAGDNRLTSLEGHVLGLVQRDAIAGRMIY